MNRHGPLLTIGEMSLDDVVVEDGHVDWKQPGGGALYSAVGARLWTDSGICSTVGLDYPLSLLEQLNTAGVDTSGIHRTDIFNSLGLWLLYEQSGARHQYEKEAGGSFQQLDSLRPLVDELSFLPTGVHLAPQSSEGHASALDDLRSKEIFVTLDLLVEPYINSGRYLEHSFLERVDAFLPSNAEVRALWGHEDIDHLRKQLQEKGFNGVLVVKRGADGVDVAANGEIIHVPAAAANVVDVTGAGDAFCGGFLAGFLATNDPVAAAAHGVVSASFVVESRGAVAALASLDVDQGNSRLQVVMKSIRRNKR